MTDGSVFSVGIKSRIKKLESSIKKGPEFDPESFEKQSAKMEEQEQLNRLAAEGDFAACLKFCKMTDEEEEDLLYTYRDMYIRILAEREGKT